MIACWIAWLLTGPTDAPVSTELALAHCHLESRGQVDVVSRVGRGMWCGQHQTTARTDAECIALRNPLASAVAFRREMSTWLRFVGGDLDRAWRGMGCGVRASRPGGVCRQYEHRVRRVARRMGMS